jgi:hypothetical protein
MSYYAKKVGDHKHASFEVLSVHDMDKLLQMFMDDWRVEDNPPFGPNSTLNKSLLGGVYNGFKLFTR